MKKSIILILILALIVFGIYLFSDKEYSEKKDDNQSDEIPFKEENSQEAPQNESLIVDNPKLNQIVSSPLNVSGKVRGTWLFEANAPVILTDWDGKIIGESYIEAQGDWMTSEFVPFKGVIEFEKPDDIGDFSDKGSIIFQKSNPSGLPENDDALEYQIKFR